LNISIWDPFGTIWLPFWHRLATLGTFGRPFAHPGATINPIPETNSNPGLEPARPGADSGPDFEPEKPKNIINRPTENGVKNDHQKYTQTVSKGNTKRDWGALEIEVEIEVDKRSENT
jgi:hypothetical protein